MLEIADVTPYLLERGLISKRAVVDGGLRIVDTSSRNRVFVVSAGDEPGLVVKQSSDAGDDGVARESAVLARLREADPRLAARLPTPLSFDPATRVLVLAAAHDAHDLRRRHARGRFSCELAAQTGRTLALLHALAPGILADCSGRGGELWLHRPSLETAQQMLSGAGADLIREIQRSDDLCAALEELRSTRRDDALIHGDVRWDNVLITGAPGAASARRSRVLLIDWESAGPGDRCADVGAFFGEYLHTWVRSIPIVDPNDPSRLLAHAGRPLARMRPAMRAFWRSYAEHRPTAGPERGRILRRAASFAAARVLMSAFEHSHPRNELPGSARFALQLSLNMLRRPDEATAHLLGLSASWR